MSNERLLKKLKELSPPQVLNNPTLPISQAISWANAVAPLLRVEPEKQQLFMNNLTKIHGFVDSATYRAAFNMMQSLAVQIIAGLEYSAEGLINEPEPLKLDNPNRTYVAESRIASLESTKSINFDTTKLIQLLKEINSAHSARMYYSIAALVRIVLDHVFPIFGCRNFSEVANNYGGSKSFKDTMGRLESVARKIGDMHIHSPINDVASELTVNQVDFSNELDVLLAEIVKILGKT
jgi:hypothetical protein